MGNASSPSCRRAQFAISLSWCSSIHSNRRRRVSRRNNLLDCDVRHVASYKCAAKLDKILLNCKKWAEFQSRGMKIKAVFEEKWRKCIGFKKINLTIGMGESAELKGEVSQLKREIELRR